MTAKHASASQSLRRRADAGFITHTEVDPAYGGQGIARRLIEEIIAEARRTGKKIVPVCSYAEKMMRGREEYTDVLAD